MCRWILLLTALALPLSACAPAATQPRGEGGTAKVDIRLNQIGYLPGAPKVATVLLTPGETGDPPLQFQVVPAAGGNPVLTGRLTGPLTEPELGGGQAWLADFTVLRTAGEYRLEVAGSDASPAFQIGPQIYEPLFRQSMRSYLLQRCGEVLDDPVTGIRHDVCHIGPALLEADRTAGPDTAGGWHDAGDYGRYMPPAAVTVGQLLLTAELLPAAAKADLQGTTLLIEARFELDWMLKMQRSDGAVYHKVTTERFPGWILPERDRAPLLIYGVGTRSTAMFAAATARGARSYQAADPAFAATLAEAAGRAWAWLEGQPHTVNPPVGQTGPYLTSGDRDAREWAAAELFALTGDPAYEAYLQERPRDSARAASWDNAGGLAYLTYALTPGADPAFKDEVTAAIRQEAKGWAERSATHPFGVALTQEEYHWASAKLALAKALHMMIADRLESDPALRQAAANQLHWVLGRNPLGRSFVTGFGTHPPQNPHHRLIAATGSMIPGLLVGGPNSKAEDKIAPAGLGPRSYVDQREAYSVNEPAIDYNAPLVFVTAWLVYGEPFR